LETRGWMYLLTGLLYPTDTDYINTQGFPETLSDINLESIGVVVKKVSVIENNRFKTGYQGGDERFAFSINNGEIDDNLAQRLADAVMVSLAVVNDIGLEEAPMAIKFPQNKINEDGKLKIKDMQGDEGFGIEQYFRLNRAVGVPSEVLSRVWQIVPAVVNNQSFMDAASFYRESIMNIWIPDDTISELMVDGDIPISNVEKANVETAYHNAFKSIEAIIGEPPSDRRKLGMKLVKQGINPDEMLGYELYYMKPGKEKLLEKLLDMQKTRDKKAAHGKTTHPREIGLCELKDKQALARHIILKSLTSISGMPPQRIFHPLS